MPGFLETVSAIEGVSVTTGEPMSRHTTWRVGGPVEYMVRVVSWAALMELLDAVRTGGTPLTVVGRGSNLLVSDRGLEGVALLLEGELAGVMVEGEHLTAGGGAALGRVVRAAAEAGLQGLEFASGIPGTVGGAVMSNAGAFGGSMADVLSSMETVGLDGATHFYESFERSYRGPLVPAEDADEIVMSAAFLLEPGSRGDIEERIEDFRARRQATQPAGVATAGSVFKNPEQDSAGSLIDACGLKGAVIGGASISGKHANFIVTGEGATAEDVMRLMELARDSVRERFGVELELEVRLLGFEGE